MTDTYTAADQIETETETGSRKKARHFWRGNIFETVAALRFRDAEIYEDWLEERDTLAITVALSRLSDRQLDRIGMNRATLPLDIDDLKEFSARNREITEEIIKIVETGGAKASAPHTPAPDRRRVAGIKRSTAGKGPGDIPGPSLSGPPVNPLVPFRALCVDVIPMGQMGSSNDVATPVGQGRNVASSGRWTQQRHRMSAGRRSDRCSERFIPANPKKPQSTRQLKQIACPGGGHAMALRPAAAYRAKAVGSMSASGQGPDLSDDTFTDRKFRMIAPHGLRTLGLCLSRGAPLPIRHVSSAQATLQHPRLHEADPLRWLQSGSAVRIASVGGTSATRAPQALRRTRTTCSICNSDLFR